MIIAPTGDGEDADGSGEPAGCWGRDDDSPSRCCVELSVPDDEPDPPLAGWLDVQLSRIAEAMDESSLLGGQISLAVVDDQCMAELHERHRGERGTTDVLTFDLRASAAGPVDGEIVLCLNEAERQASLRGHDTRLELLLYAVHGLLHLLGYDDVEPADAKRMHQREDELLRLAGFPSVYGKTD